MARFRVSSKAQQDIVDISDFIRRDNPGRALSFARELRARIALAAETPLAYRERLELKPGIRAVRHGQYLIFYRLTDEALEVLRVRHGARDVEGLFEDE